MKRTREDVAKKKFVILNFAQEEGDLELRDGIVRAAMIEERLRPVTHDEFWKYIHDVLRGRKPKAPVVAFGNTTRGDADTGSFPGVPYLDTDGEVKIVENWTRGNTGDQWGYDCKFLFAPVT